MVMDIDKVRELAAQLQQELEKFPATPKPNMISGKLQHPQGEEITRLKNEVGALRNKSEYNEQLAENLKGRLNAWMKAYKELTEKKLTPDEIHLARTTLIATDDIQAVFRAVMEKRTGEDYANEVQQEG